MITLQSIQQAVLVSLRIRERIRAREAVLQAEKKRQQRETEAAWRNERERRVRAALDRDGSIAAARKQREQAREEEHLAQIAAQLIRRQANAH